jgi:glycosyltransferase involved in cell wall biosynthesis
MNLFDRIVRRTIRERDFCAEWLRERMELIEEARLLHEARNGNQLCWEADDEPEPLVTVRIATFDIGPTIAERALASVSRQTYSRLEILVVGDRCDDATARAVQSFPDPRIHFVNLPARGNYPSYREYRRKVAGAHPMNVALTLAQGKWIAPCDDDDEFTTDHVESLLKAVRSLRVEMVYSKTLNETKPGAWAELGSLPLRQGHISHGSVLYSARLRFMKHSTTSWKLHSQPSDWNLWNRMQRIGVKIGFLDQITYKHYLGAYQREQMQRGALKSEWKMAST